MGSRTGVSLIIAGTWHIYTSMCLLFNTGHEYRKKKKLILNQSETLDNNNNSNNNNVIATTFKTTGYKKKKYICTIKIVQMSLWYGRFITGFQY